MISGFSFDRLRTAAITLTCRTLARAFPHCASLDLSRRPVQRVLVLKPCCIGDVLMATPALQALRRALPQARIAVGVGAWSRVALEGNPDVDELIDTGMVGIRGRYSLADVVALVRRLRRDRFDAALVLDRSPVVASLPWLAGIPWRAGLDSRGRGFALQARVRVPRRGVRHEVDLYLDVVRAAGIPVDDTPEARRLKFVPSPQDSAAAERLLRSLGLPGRRQLIVIHPGGGANPGMTLALKRWPAEHFGQLAARLERELGATVLIVGARSDQDICMHVLETARRAGGAPVDLCARLSFGQLGALAARCDLYIGNDAGTTHLAAAAGAPVLALFGPSAPYTYGPTAPGSAALWLGVPCSPCFVDGTAPPCPFQHRCMAEMEVERVFRRARALLEGRL
jgi:lipopolysaccharide heptosyltransferase II